MNNLEAALDRVDGSTGSVRSAAERVLSENNCTYKGIVQILFQKLQKVGMPMHRFAVVVLLVLQYLIALLCRLRHSGK